MYRKYPYGEVFEISEFEGMYNLYWQMLAGDKQVDNIQGIPGIGKVKAAKILEGLETELEMHEAVLVEYIRINTIKEGDESLDDVLLRAVIQMNENAHLLWMLRELNENGSPVHWSPPT